jgi:uncharacterized membrane protein YhaH (DUF805 family)
MMWLILSWVIGLIVSLCISVPFLIKRNLDEDYAGIIILLVVCPIVNVLYPIYIMARYIKLDFKKFL